jgi:putative acetyltransferase
MAPTIRRERADSPEALTLLAARDAESDALYPPESQFQIPIGSHARQDVIFLIGREEGSAIGCGALQLHAGYAELKSIYVVPEARGRRLGEAIVRELEDLARGFGFDDLKLETGVRSPAAIRLYERAGYRRCERFGDYPDEPLSVFMAKKLSVFPFAPSCAAAASAAAQFKEIER